jgi:hypothetical protein
MAYRAAVAEAALLVAVTNARACIDMVCMKCSTYLYVSNSSSSGAASSSLKEHIKHIRRVVTANMLQQVIQLSLVCV